MAKKLVFVGVFFMSLFIFPGNVLAACTPPTDYRGCQPVLIGTNGPQLMDQQYKPVETDFKNIRDMANSAGMTNNRVPATIIVTDGTAGNHETLLQIYKNADKYGVDLVIRTWGNNPDVPVAGKMGEDFSAVNKLAQQAGVTVPTRIEMGNEVNAFAGNTDGVSGSKYAEAFSAFVKGCASCNVVLPSMGGPPSANDSKNQFIKDFLAKIDTATLRQVDGIVFNSYGETAEKAATDWLNTLQMWKDAAGNKINFSGLDYYLTEIGPADPTTNNKNLEGDVQTIANKIMQLMNDPNAPAAFKQLDGVSFFVWAPDEKLLLVTVDPKTGKVTMRKAGDSNNLPGKIVVPGKTWAKIICETANSGMGQDESRVNCPGNCGASGEQGNGIAPKYFQGEGKPTINEMSNPSLTYGIGVQGMGCGQARSDSVMLQEYAPYDLFEKNDPELCESKHDWTGEAWLKGVSVPFAEYLARHWAGFFDAEHYTAEQMDDLRMADPKKVANEIGVLGKLLPRETQDELRAEFIRYIQQRGDKTMYKNFEINGIKLAAIETPPVKPSSTVALGFTEAMISYRENLAEWANRWREPVLSYMGLFPNEAVKGQVKFDLCGDRVYQDVAMMFPYPEMMKLGLAANEIFKISQPQKTQDIFYKENPEFKDPYLVLNRKTQLTDASEAIKGEEPVAQLSVSPTIPPQKNIFEKLGDFLSGIMDKLGVKTNSVFAAQPKCGNIFDLDIEVEEGGTNYAAVIKRNDCGIKEMPGLLGHVKLYQEKDVGGTGQIHDFYLSECSKDKTVCPVARFTPNDLPGILPTFSTYEELKQWMTSGPLRIRADYFSEAPHSPTRIKTPSKNLVLSGGGGGGACDPTVACCVTPYCAPKTYPFVQFGPPMTGWLVGGTMQNSGNVLFGVDWPLSGAVMKPVNLTFKKDDWKDYSGKDILPGNCSFLNPPVDSELTSCSVNSNCPGWGGSGGWGCDKSKQICRPFVCVKTNDREAGVYNNCPYCWSLWEQTASDCVGECEAQGNTPTECRLACVKNNRNFNGFFKLFQPELTPAQIISDKKSYGKIFDQYGNFIPAPGATKVGYSFTMNFIPSSGAMPYKKGISDVVMTSPSSQNLLFYRIGGVCNADKWFSQQILNPAGFGPKQLICGTAPNGVGSYGAITRVDLPDLPEIDGCDVIVNGPPDDNGRCVHFAANGRLSQSVINQNIQRMKEMNIKWALVPYGADENELKKYATAFKDSGIMPIWRPLLTPDKNYQANTGWGRDTKILVDMGYKNPIIQIYNEPLNEAEWGDNGVDESLWLYNLANAAAEVYKAGGLPGIQIMDGAELKIAIDVLRAKGGEKLLSRMVVIPHLYSADGRTPGSTNEYSILGQLYDIQKTLDAEGISNTPIISGESGFKESTVGYDLQKQADFTKETMDWFTSGVMSDGKSLPSNLVALCQWQLSGVGASSENTGGSWFDNGTEKNAGGGTEKTNITNLLRGDDKYKTRIPAVCPPKGKPATAATTQDR